MAKSLKRAIATLLAVLMVAFSMPFTALAAAGDYEPDIELMFFPVWMDGGWGNYDDIVGAKGKDVSYHITDGAGDVALDYNKTAGTLTLSASKAATYLELNETDIADTILADGDYTLGEGDYFAATVVVKNISTLYAISTAIKYSDNIVPAGVYVTQTGSGTRRIQTAHMAAVDDFASTAVSTAGPYFDDFSGTLYGLDTEMNEIDANGNMFVACAGDEPYSDVSAVDADTAAGFMNPKTGAEGWDAAGTAILGTFIFKIVDDTTPITFEAADPNNQIYAQYAGGLFIANVDDGIAVPRDITTVAGGTHAGAGKMTYFAAEEDPPAQCTHENTSTSYENVVPATCTEAGSRDVVVTCDDCGAEISRTNEEIPALGHDLGDWAETTAAVAPTCLNAGATAIETRTCSRCDYSETRGGDEVAALGHDYVAGTPVAATCTEQGYTTYTCSRCGDSYDADYVDALGHDPAAAVQENVVGASCTEAGSYDSVVYCSRCQAELSRDNVTVDALGHDLGDWAETTAAVAPTCTAAGATAIETRTCSRCDYSETRGGEAVDALGHDFGEWTQTTDPSCTEAGEETRYCSRCDATETRPVDALGHNYVAVVTDPTCTEQGYTTWTCSRCDASYVDSYTDALGHDFGEWAVTTDPTCTDAGEETRYCSRCDATETRPVDALGHDFGEWTVTTDPTCTEAGEETRYCSRCDATETRPVDALGHVEEEIPAVAATCTETGLTAGVKCSRCGTILTAQETVAALGHDLGDWEASGAAVEPTCTLPGANGGEIRRCSRCDYFETRGGEEIPALGHDPAAAVTENNVDPTCTVAGGYDTVVYCSRCGAELSREHTEVAALGHDAAAAVEENRVEPSCTEAGSYDSVVYCSRCQAELSRDPQTIDALGHDLGDWAETTAAVAPTCTEAGATAIETRTCSRCDYSETRGGDEVEALGHDAAAAVEENRVEPSCTEAGSYDSVVYCSRCQAELSRDPQTIDALGHDLGEWEASGAAVEPTCTQPGANGGEIRRCSRCDYYETRGGEEIPALGHAPADAVTENNVEPTCTDEGGYDTVVYCSRCGAELSREHTTIEALGHVEGEAVIENNVDPSCTVAGGYDTVVYCTRCDAELSRVHTDVDALGHAWGEWEETTAPTQTAAGEESRTCSRCGAVETRPVAALGINLTVKGSADGSVSGSVTTEVGGEDVTVALPYGSNYTLTANGTNFIGWSVNGKIVSQSKTYKGVLYTDYTVEPVFGSDDAETYSVYFYDKYGNLVQANTGLKADDFATMEIPADVKVQVPGYKFKNWGKTEDEIRANVASVSYWAVYEKDEDAATFTVTTNAVEGNQEGLTYGKKVTLTADADDAEWVINNEVVGYGKTYVLTVTADTEINWRAKTAEEAVVVAITSVSNVSGTKYQYNATRSVPAGYTVIDQGFVYGKNMSEDDLKVENEGKTGAGGAAVRVKRFATTSTSFAVQYSVSSGTASVKAFVTVKAADGTITTVYSTTVER